MEVVKSNGVKVVAIYPIKATKKNDKVFKDLKFTVAKKVQSYDGEEFDLRVCITAKGSKIDLITNAMLSIGDVVNVGYITTSRQYTKLSTDEVMEMTETKLISLEVVSSAMPTPRPEIEPQPATQADTDKEDIDELPF